jgi:hypothetical protein
MLISALATSPVTVLGLKPLLPVVEKTVVRGRLSDVGAASAAPTASPNAAP